MTTIRWRDFSSALLVLVAGIIYVIWAQTYPRDLGTVPTLAGALAIGLSLIDAVSQIESSLGRSIRRFLGSDRETSLPQDRRQAEVGWQKIVYSILWPLGYVAAIVVFGFLLVTPPYIFFYMYLYGRKTILTSAISAAVTTFVIWFAFHILFQYPLFPGLLFGGNW
jgi:Tripartite tricarboxylate transporter TctB family